MRENLRHWVARQSLHGLVRHLPVSDRDSHPPCLTPFGLLFACAGLFEEGCLGGGRRTFRRLSSPLYGWVWLATISSMPRKPTLQPAPVESFTLNDGTAVEVRDRHTREIGRGLDKKWVSEELDWQVLIGLIDDLISGRPQRRARAMTALKSDHAMARHLLNGGYDMDDRTARRHGRKIRTRYRQTQRIETVVKGTATVLSAPCPEN